jgi:hypothetical protein
MHPVIVKIFGGLSRQYYLRQFVFGLIFPAMIWFFISHANRPMPFSAASIGIALMVINSCLYPYSRFVYESIIEFIMGRNVFFVNAILMLVTKFVTMLLCWYLALLIAPVGLLYLYLRNGRADAAA